MAMKWEASAWDHFQTSNNPVQSFICNFCGFVSQSSLEYQNHTLTHMQGNAGGKKKTQGGEKKPKVEKMDDAKPYPCSSCYVMCTSAAALKKHVKENHPEEKVKRPRTKLEAMRGIGSKMEQDVKPKKPKKEKEMPVTSICSKCGGLIEKTKLHFCTPISNLIPLNQFFPFKCSNCDFSASTQLDVDIHELTHMSGSTKSFGGPSAKSSSSMEIVKKRTDDSKDDEKSIKCPFNCGYAGAREDLLKAHLERKHGALSSNKVAKVKDEAPPPKAKAQAAVAKAPKKVADKPEKKSKILLPPVEEKTFQCGMCDYAGAKKELLKGHMQRVHGATDNKTSKKNQDKGAGSTVVTLSSATGVVKVKVGQSSSKAKKGNK